MRARDALAAELRSALAAEAGTGGASTPFVVERPRSRAHGDWSSNAALAAAGKAGVPPRELAERLAARVRCDPPPHLESVDVAGPGFVNFRMAPESLYGVLKDVVSAGVDGYGRSDEGGGQSVSVEFVSANPTGPLHAGHGRWAAYGDSLCWLLERCGYRVRREFYINDRGGRIDALAESLVAARDGAAAPEDGYAGDYIAEWAAEMPAGADPREWAVARARQDQEEALAAMGVAFDAYTSETALVDSGAMADILERLRSRGVVYEQDGAVMLRSSDYGDSEDRALVKGSGEPTYVLPDIAFHHQKLTQNDLTIDVFGADHHSYVPRMRAALSALGHDLGTYEALVGQLVTLRSDDETVRMGKRSGVMVYLSDLLDSVGADVTRLVYLLQQIDTAQTVDLRALSAQSGENPVYYLQYAHARIHSLGRRAASLGVRRVPLQQADLSRLTHTRELEILRGLEDLPDVIVAAMKARAPHQLTAWAREQAAAFHRFWHDCPILADGTGDDLRQARLWLVEAARTGLAVALGGLGVSAPEQLADLPPEPAGAARGRKPVKPPVLAAQPGRRNRHLLKQKILAALKANPHATHSQIAAMCAASRSYVSSVARNATS